MSDRDDARSLVNIIMASLLAAAVGFIILMLFYSRAQGETRMRASSTVYTQGANAAPSYRKHRKYRYTYRRSRSRAAVVSAREAPAVSEPASRPLLAVPAEQIAHLYRQTQPEEPEIEPLAQWTGPVMLERGDPEPEPSNLHLVALGAIAAAFAALLIYAATGGQRERQPSQWAPWSDA